MTTIERYGIEAVICALLIFGIVTYLEHRGAAKYEKADAVIVAKQEARNAEIAAADSKAINQEVIDHAKAIAAAPEPTPALICVRKFSAPRALPGNPAAAPVSHDATPVPAPSGPSFDPGPQLGAIGRDADAQVIELQSYVRDVCLNSGANRK